ncbi:MAG: sulfatase-like hydrolase/transferase [Oscillospiraceae bacterium]|nr:sulfatase-like hydrolase/transferase [Oscillospiraceae bacterium]
MSEKQFISSDAGASAAPQAQAPDQAPDILLIICDQLRYDCVGSSRARPVKTPHMDAIARGGARFLNAFTPQPLCCPARQSLLTSRRPERDGLLWNHDITLKTPSLMPGERLWPTRLREAGYRMAYVGKWHESADYPPTAFGYDTYDSDDDYAAYREGAFGPADFQGWIGGEVDPAPTEHTHTHWLARQACRRLDEFIDGEGTGSGLSTGAGAGAGSSTGTGAGSSAEAGPWHLRVDFSEPHPPYRPAAEFARMYDARDIAQWDSFCEDFHNKPYIQKQMIHTWGIEDYGWDTWSTIVARYYAYVSQLDDAIGKILATLARSGRRDNTLVILTPDHGDMCGAHRMVDKHNVLYDDIVHVPLLMMWPRVLRPGMEIDAFVQNTLDIGPTLLEAAGLHRPGGVGGSGVGGSSVGGSSVSGSDAGVGDKGVGGTGVGDASSSAEPVAVDGRSLFPLFSGAVPSDWRDCAVSSYNGQQFGLYTQRMIRNNEWKYIWNTADMDELYCLRDDPAELENRVYDPCCADVLKDMRRGLHDVLVKEGDGLLKSHWMRNQLLGVTKKL